MFTRLLIGLFILSVLVFIWAAAVWMELEPIEEFRRLATSQPRYCAVFTDRHGEYLDALYVLPDQAEYVRLDSVPQFFIDDLVFFEDQHFWHHPGFWPPGIVRAILGWGKAGGGSTLTQQTYRLLTKHKERTLYRKAIEIIGSVKLSFALTKKEQLEVYLNNAWFGTGPKVGLTAAARTFFSKSTSELTREEGIMLIAFLNRPPRGLSNDLALVYRRYDRRVARLVAEGRVSVSDPEYMRLANGPAFRRHYRDATSYGVFLDRAVDEAYDILENTGWSLEKDGLIVETTLDKRANDSISSILESLLPPAAKDSSGFVYLNQENEVIAYLSRTRSLPGDLDILTSDQTMSASRFKVVAYALAVERMLSSGLSPNDVLNTMLPMAYRIPEGRIVGHPGEQPILLRKAISESKNAPAYFVANRITSPQEIVEFCKLFSKAELKPWESIAMGSQGFSELSLCHIYSTLLVREGYLRRPSFIRRILDPQGKVVYDNTWSLKNPEQRVISSEAGRCLRQALREAASEGTSKLLMSAHDLTLQDVAVKTGTSKGNFHLGVTGVLDQSTFSLMIQGKQLGGSAGQVAVPVAKSILLYFTHRRNHTQLARSSSS